MKKLLRFHAGFGRMGSLEGLFVSTEEDFNKLLGKRIHFGEVLGKHSDISLRMDAGNFSVLTEDQDFIKKFEEFGLATGTNPFHYLDEDEEEESE